MARNRPERSAYRCLLSGVKRKCRVGVGTSGFDPKADIGDQVCYYEDHSFDDIVGTVPSLREAHEAARVLVAALGSAAVAWPQSARAQQFAAPVVGLLASGLEAQSQHLIGFSKGLSEIGFVEGQNVGIQYRFAEGHYDRLPAMVAELVNRHVAVLAASGGVQTALAVKAANTLPTARIFGILINPKNDNAENQMKDIAQGR